LQSKLTISTKVYNVDIVDIYGVSEQKTIVDKTLELYDENNPDPYEPLGSGLKIVKF